MLHIPTLTDVPKIALRDYQQMCVERVLTAYHLQPSGGKALIVLPTGGGKTIVFAEIARRLGLNTLIIAHRHELLQQAADKFRMIDPTAIIGQVGAGRNEYGAPITVASVQTISRLEHLKNLPLFDYGLVIIDECFPAGTLIDGKPIEHIQVGDLVTAFNEHTQTFARKRVVRTFRRSVGPRLLKITADHVSVVCTPNHPYYTPSGWKAAEQLSRHDEVLSVPNHDHRPLHAVPTPVPFDQETPTRSLQTGQSGVLFGRVPMGAVLSHLLTDHGFDQSPLRLGSYEGPQSDATGSVTAENARNALCHGAQTEDPWRQWKRPDPSATAPCSGSGRGLADGIRGQNSSTSTQRASGANQLQNRPGSPDPESSHRDRWDVPRGTSAAGIGPQERATAQWVRVDRLEVYESAGDRTVGGLCPDGVVYNFEVEDDHTYLANGFVVHNCHHGSASGYQAVLEKLPDAFVLGVTATPDRLDGQNIEAIFGEPVFSANIVDMVEQGYLCDLQAIAVRTTTSLDTVHTQAGDFKQDELEEVIDTQEGNQRVVNAYLEHGRGRQALCFAVTLAHAYHLMQALRDVGIRVDVVSGETPLEERKRILHDYERGHIEVLCNCGVLLEGFDSPQTSCIIMARPTKSRALYTQAIGRGTRLAPGKANCIILDVTDNCLKHRLEPQSLSKALELSLLDGESITEGQKRERLGREQKERTDTVTKRTQDLVVDILARLDWKRRRSNGAYTLEIGESKHKIMLLPSEHTDGYYSVWAELAPDYQRQQWLKDSPLEWAQQHAEIKARLLQSDEKKVILVDNNAVWRTRPASLKQICLLRKYEVPFTAEITSGEASDLIGKVFADKEKAKAEKAAKKGQGKRGKVSA